METQNINIQFLKREEINDALWNKSIDEAFNGNIYAYTWYLDIVSPGWAALASSDYTYLFPLPVKKKYGVSYVVQPLFCQQLGLFSTRQISPEIVDRFIDSIPSNFRYVNINLNIHNKTNKHKSSVEKKVTYMLDLLNYNDQLFRRYNQNTRRNIFKATAYDTKAYHIDPEEFSRFYKRWGYMLDSRKDINTISQLAHTLKANQRANIYGAANNSMSLGGVALFAESHNTIYYLFGAAEPVSRVQGSLFFLLDTIIRNNAEQNKVLDFEGSTITSIANFFKGFGAKPCNFLTYHRNTLPAGELIVKIKREMKLF